SWSGGRCRPKRAHRLRAGACPRLSCGLITRPKRRLACRRREDAMKTAQAALATFALALVLTGTAHGQAVEKRQVTLAVGGKTALYYLPLTICERLGYFKEQGLDVTINDFRGGAQSLQALVGGSVDVVTGAYEHTIRMQAKGQDIKAVIELGRFPGIVVAVRKD